MPALSILAIAAYATVVFAPFALLPRFAPILVRPRRR
jgi:hypothetical protein